MNHAISFSSQLQQISHNLELHAPLPALALIHEMNSANPRANPKQKIALLLLKAQAETELGQSYALSNTLNEAFDLSQTADLALERLQIMNQLADQMYTMGNYRQSIQLWLNCIELGLELGDTTTAIAAFISIGGIFNAADEHERAYKLHLQALQYCRNIATPYIYCTIRQCSHYVLINSFRKA